MGSIDWRSGWSFIAVAFVADDLEEDEDVASAASAAAAADDDEHINAVMISSSIQLLQQEEVTVNQWRYIPLYVDTFAEGMTFQTTF